MISSLQSSAEVREVQEKGGDRASPLLPVEDPALLLLDVFGHKRSMQEL